MKNITDFDFESLSAKINGVLIIDIALNYKGLVDEPIDPNAPNAQNPQNPPNAPNEPNEANDDLDR